MGRLEAESIASGTYWITMGMKMSPKHRYQHSSLDRHRISVACDGDLIRLYGINYASFVESRFNYRRRSGLVKGIDDCIAIFQTIQ